ncbi:GntR family transcriptional regulator [Variovorax soli]|uniref:GntR family transcriptional regulator of vanillate catabolism n=1 Tax=Variovorax soli TaxID=376815 RepID=A0ABU1NIB2_9BURK|nr:GntR family transcriptional regulator [Variovorax soli]MDR6538175.1 GntR family transcriptional regulator of vanillate catabolism [Variovorax soli]
MSAAEPSENGSSQAVKAQLRLREMVLAGELAGGARITEVAISELLGVSRTPVRSALMRLEQEGLLEALPNGGYAVRTFSERDVADAIELRGTLEGLAARLAAERGAAPVVLREARACLKRIDELLREPALDDAAFSRYVAFNEQFHRLLSEMAGSPLIAQQLERATSLPFASPSGFVVVQANSPAARDMLVIAQDQHGQVLDAIENREGTRAEALMREHSRIAQRNLREALHGTHLHPLPGVQLIRRRA